MASGFATLANWRGFLGATHGLVEFFHLDVLGDIAQELRAFCCRLGNDFIPLVLENGRQHAGCRPRNGIGHLRIAHHRDIFWIVDLPLRRVLDVKQRALIRLILLGSLIR